MKTNSCLFLVVLFLRILPAQSQVVSVVKFERLKQMISQPADTLYVINFWATWCAPCVKELPQFEAVRRAYAGQNVKVLLVSMDAREDLKKRVVPFVRTRNIRSQVVLLDETDANTWIDKIAPEWSGALPMTLIVNATGQTRRFIDKPVKADELIAIINQYKR